LIKTNILKTTVMASTLMTATTIVYSNEQPNVIVVLTDDQGYGDLGCHGNPWIKTPAMDKLHSESIRFTNFHVSPTCSPTRGALMTGRYPNAIGTWHTINGRNLMWKDEKTLADTFAKNGYKTGFFGKWHLGDNSPHRPQDRGFQEVLMHGGGGIGQTPDFWSNDYFDDTYLRNGVPEKFTGYCTDIWFNEAEKFISRNKTKPFFAFISTNAPHAPFHIDQKYVDIYKNKNVPNAKFYGMITNIDDNLAKLRKFLAKNKLQDNTILIFMTDNGTVKGYSEKRKNGFNSGMRGKKGTVYEGGHRVPFFIYWAKGELSGGKDIDTLSAHIDLLPTLAELCHLKRTKGKKLHGRSLVPLLYGSPKKWPKRVLVTDSQRVHIPVKWKNSSTMTQKWRLINGNELYDIKNDSGQKQNLAKQHPDIVASLRQEYDKWWNMVSSDFKGKIAAIAVGTKQENPVKLTSHDWYMDKNNNSVWSQNLIREGIAKNGFWIIDVKTAGNYEIALRRWPRSTKTAINAPIPRGNPIPYGTPFATGQAIHINKARIKMANINQTKKIHKQDQEAVFNVSLKPGQYRLQTWFYGNDAPEGDLIERGAYYVYIMKKP
jgi:arylsulfatase A-like enzyme